MIWNKSREAGASVTTITVRTSTISILCISNKRSNLREIIIIISGSSATRSDPRVRPTSALIPVHTTSENYRRRPGSCKETQACSTPVTDPQQARACFVAPMHANAHVEDFPSLAAPRQPGAGCRAMAARAYKIERLFSSLSFYTPRAAVFARDFVPLL